MSERKPWRRLYREALHDPKIVMLNDRQFRAWVGCLMIADDAGRLPSLRDLACDLRMPVHDVERLLAELVEAGLVDPDMRSGVPAYAVHGWAKRQFVATDSSTERSRKCRERKRERSENGDEQRDCNVAATSPQQPQRQSQNQNKQLLPPEIPRERRTAPPRGGGAQAFDVGFAEGPPDGGGGMASSQRRPPGGVPSGVRGRVQGMPGRPSGFERLKRVAEGLGLPVGDLEVIIDRQKPRSPQAYFRGMCLVRLRERAPGVADAVLSAALDGRPDAIGVVTCAILAEAAA